MVIDFYLTITYTMLMDAKTALTHARAICATAHVGGITYDEAKARCMPLIAIVNAKGRQIAAKYGKRYTPISFTGLLR